MELRGKGGEEWGGVWNVRLRADGFGVPELDWRTRRNGHRSAVGFSREHSGDELLEYAKLRNLGWWAIQILLHESEAQYNGLTTGGRATLTEVGRN